MKKLWQSSKKKTAGTSAMPTKQQDSPSFSIYQHINSLPLRNFITCIVDKNLSALIISGYPSLSDLEFTWNEILQQYSWAIGTNEQKLYLSVFKEVALLKNKYDVIQECIGILKDLLDVKIEAPQMVAFLNKEVSASFLFDVNDPEKYLKELASANMRSKQYKISLDLKTAHLEALQRKTEGKSQVYTREYFDAILITLSDYAKYEILEDNITVSKYCERVKRYTSYVETLSKKK